jgi:NADPH-dependent 2,4-dienoyl-CoA reductase/sulfur reductase-like enzyme
MKSYDYLIVGGGMAAAAAIKGIRELDRDGSIGVLGAEPDPPYDRPPLSKGLWRGKPIEAIWMDAADADLRLGRFVKELQSSKHAVVCEDGELFEYGRLLIATGGRPRRLSPIDDSAVYLRDLRDYRDLRARCEGAQRFLVVGGGLIASEIAAALAMTGKRVALAFPEEGIAARLLPRDISRWLNEFYRGKGVEVFPGESVGSLETQGSLKIARTLSGKAIDAEVVVAGLGILPNADFAAQAGLLVEDGISVGPELRSSDPDVFAAGDVASFYCGALGRRIRPEHEDNALAMGLAAGRNMAGADEPYDRIPYFYSDLFDLGYEAVGELDPSRETFIDWKSRNESAVVYYLDGGRLRGVLLWNVRKRSEAARALIAETGPFRPEELVGRL